MERIDLYIRMTVRSPRFAQSIASNAKSDAFLTPANFSILKQIASQLPQKEDSPYA